MQSVKRKVELLQMGETICRWIIQNDENWLEKVQLQFWAKDILVFAPNSFAALFTETQAIWSPLRYIFTKILFWAHPLLSWDNWPNGSSQEKLSLNKEKKNKV